MWRFKNLRRRNRGFIRHSKLTPIKSIGVGLIAIAVFAAASGAAAAAYLGGDGEQHRYRILVRGVQIGMMSVTYQPGPNATYLITTDTSYKAPGQQGASQSVRFVTREIWDTNGFSTLKGRVASGAADARFSARRMEDGSVQVLGTRQNHTISAGALPLQFWNADTMRAPLVYEPITGTPIAAQRQKVRDDVVTVADKQISCAMYQLTSNTGTIELWYDKADMLCFARVSGSNGSFVYVRESATKK